MSAPQREASISHRNQASPPESPRIGHGRTTVRGLRRNLLLTLLYLTLVAVFAPGVQAQTTPIAVTVTPAVLYEDHYQEFSFTHATVPTITQSTGTNVTHNPAGSTATPWDGITGDYSKSGVQTSKSTGTTVVFGLSGIKDNLTEGDETINLVISIEKSDGTHAQFTTSITLKDSPPPSVILSRNEFELTEGNAVSGSADYTVKLGTNPMGTVTVTATSPDSGAVTVQSGGGSAGASTTLTFDTTNWQIPQTVTVAAVVDGDGDDETLLIGHTTSATTGPYQPSAVVKFEYEYQFDVRREDGAVSVKVRDKDNTNFNGITVSPRTINLTEEEASKTYTVKLDKDPGGTVTVFVVPDTAAVYAVTTGSRLYNNAILTFDSNNFGTAQTVTINAPNDFNNTHEQERITHSFELPDGLGTWVVNKDMLVYVTDNDVGTSPGVSINRTSIELNDYYDQADLHKSTPYYLRLDTDPGAQVQITVTSSDVTAVKVDTDKNTDGDQSTLTFDSDDWHRDKEVRLTVVADADYTPETVTITHTASVSTDTTNPYDGITITPVTVNVNEYPEPNLLFDQFHCGEGLTDFPNNVALYGPPPDQPVTLSLSIDPPTLGTLSTNTVTITPPNLQSASFTFTCSDDMVSNAPFFKKEGTFRVSASGSGLYSGVTAMMNVTVLDDEDATFDVVQGDTKTINQIVALVQDGGDVHIDAVSGDTSAMTVTPARHTWRNNLDSLANKNFAISFLNTGNTQMVEVKLDFTPSAHYHFPIYDHIYRIHPQTPTTGVTITQSGTPAVTTVSEDGTTTTDTYTVVLDSLPTHDVTVTVNAGTGVQVNKAGSTAGSSQTLTFTPSGTGIWNTAQTITVTGTDDGTDNPGGSREVTISHTSSSSDSSYNNLTIDSVAATVTDDDATTVTLTTPDTTAAEGNTADTASLTLTLGRGLVNTEALVVPLNFTGGVPGTLFTLACPNTLPTGVTCQNLSTANPQVTFTGPNTGTTAVAVTLTLTAEDDMNVTSETVTASIPASSTGSAPKLTATNLAGGATGSRTGNGQITISDNDSAGVTLVEPGNSTTVNENGTTDTYTLVLTSEPTHNVIVTVNAGAGTDVKVDGPDSGTAGTNSETLTFTPTTWDDAQTITVNAVDDNADNPGGTRTATISHSATSTDTNYHQINIDSITATVTDDDATTVTLTGPAGNVTEGNTKTITLTLNRGLIDGETLTVPLTFAGTAARNTDYTLACPSSLPTGVTCHNLNTGNARVVFTGPNTGATATVTTITLTATNDGSTETPPETVNIGLGTLTHTGLDAGGTSKTDNLANFLIEDPPPTPTLSVTLSHAARNEGATGAKTYATVTLNLNPPRSQTTTFKACLKNTGTATRGSNADYQFVNAGNDTPLTLGNDDCYTATINANGTSQSVRLLIHDDMTEEPDETVVVELRDAPTGVTISATARSATFTIRNDDTPGLVFSTPSLTVAEGGTRSYTVKLATEPTASVTVTITSSNRDAVTVNPASLTFTRTGSNLWSTAQTVTVSAEEDTDDSVTLTHRASNGGYNDVTGNVAVRVTDNDVIRPPPPPPPPPPSVTPDVSITAGEAISEGGEAIFTLTADPAPATSLIVHVRVTQDGNFATSGQTGTRSVSLGPDGTARLTIATVDDVEDEPDGSLTATVEPGDGYSPHPTNEAASVEVTDNDDPPVTPEVAFASATTRAAENAGTQEVSVTLAPPPAAALTLTYTAGGTATAGAGNDYTLPPAGTLSVAVNQATVTIPVALRDDHVAEEPETVILTLIDGQGYTVGTATVHTLTITDDDTAGIRSAPSTVHLTEAGDTATVTLHLTSQPTAPVTVTLTSSRTRVAAVTPATLTFPPSTWQTSQRVTVTAVADGITTLTATVQSHDPVYAALAPGALPRVRVRVGADLTALTNPWLARFGRTVTGQAVTGITTRLSASRTPGLTGTVAGLALDRLGDDPATDQTRLTPEQSDPPDPRLNPGGRLLNFRDLLAGSAFALTSAPSDTGGSYAIWGQGAWTRFAGQDGAWNVDGDTLGGTLGMDWAQGSWILGVAVSHTRGEGDSASTKHQGNLESSLTLVTPYVGVDVTERVTLWGTLGYGRGTLTLTLPTEPEVETDTALLLAAGGMRGQLREPDPTGGLALAVRSEARFLRTTAEGAEAQGLDDVEANVGLFRLGLEGTWRRPLAEGGSLVPRLDLGLRQDTGDAETGLGLEVRGGIRWEAPARGLTLDMTGQTLLAHSDREFETWGGTATVQWDPDPVSAAGPTLTLRQTYGAGGVSGAGTFWTENPVAVLPAPGPANLHLTAEFGWGLPLQSGLGVPHVAYGWAPASRNLSLGWRLLPTRATDLTLSLTATHREAARTVPAQGLSLSLTRTW